MRFQVFDISIGVIRAVRPLLSRIEQRDKGLAKQLREAASSVPLNLSEGRRRVGKDRLHFWRIAAGSADETRACLLVSEAWGYVLPDDTKEPLDLLDSVLAITWTLTH